MFVSVCVSVSVCVYEEASYSWAKGHKKSQSWPQLAGQMSDKTLTVSCTSNCLLHLPSPLPGAYTRTRRHARLSTHADRAIQQKLPPSLSPPLFLGSLASNLHSKKATCRARFGSNFDFWPQGCVFATPPSLYTLPCLASIDAATRRCGQKVSSVCRAKWLLVATLRHWRRRRRRQQDCLGADPLGWCVCVCVAQIVWQHQVLNLYHHRQDTVDSIRPMTIQ